MKLWFNFDSKWKSNAIFDSFSECFCWTNNILSIGGTNATNSFRIIGGGLIYYIVVKTVGVCRLGCWVGWNSCFASPIRSSDKEAGFEVGDTQKNTAKGWLGVMDSARTESKQCSLLLSELFIFFEKSMHVKVDGRSFTYFPVEAPKMDSQPCHVTLEYVTLGTSRLKFREQRARTVDKSNESTWIRIFFEKRYVDKVRDIFQAPKTVCK